MHNQPSQKDIDKEEAKADCVKHGTPTMGVDHGKPSPYADNTGRKTLAELTRATYKAFGIKEIGNEQA